MASDWDELKTNFFEESLFKLIFKFIDDMLMTSLIICSGKEVKRKMFHSTVVLVVGGVIEYFFIFDTLLFSLEDSDGVGV